LPEDPAGSVTLRAVRFRSRVPPGLSEARVPHVGDPTVQRLHSPIVSLDARHAPSYPAQCAGDALGERASSLRFDRVAAGTPCPTPHRGVGQGVLGKATARFAGHTCTHCAQCGVTVEPR